jgi:hypothetical protein
MPIIPQPTLDYSQRDFNSLRLRLQGLARSVFPAWTDFNTANYGNLLLEMMAYVGDNLSFYLDAQAREMFWPTLTRRLSAVRQGRLINFKLTGAAQSTGIVRISIPSTRTTNVLVNPGTIIRSLDPVNPLLFQTTNGTVAQIPAGQLFVDVAAEQTQSVVGEVYTSTGAPNQEFVLSQTPFLEGSLTITATDGTYTEIDSFVEVTESNPRVFVVLVDQNDRARVRFGNGTLGKIPVGTISFNYKTTQGSGGNINTGMLGTLQTPIVDSISQSVNGVSVTNLGPFSGGADRMTVAQARALGPASLRALTRSVSNPDFETHALEVPGIARALMLTSNQDISIPENSGVLLLIAFGPLLASGNYAAALPTQPMINSVKQKFIDKPPTTTFSLSVQAAPFKAIDVSTRVYLEKGAVTTTVKAGILSALADLFSVALSNGVPNTAVDFGANLTNSEGIAVGEIAWSGVMNAILDVDGIRKVDEGPTGLLLNGLRQSITIGLRQFPQLGKVTIIDADTGVTL